MTADEAIEEVLRLARDPSLSDDEVRAAVRGVLMRLAPDERDATMRRAQAPLAEQRLH